MYIGISELMFLCVIAILLLGLPAIMFTYMTKMSKRVDQLEKKLKEDK